METAAAKGSKSKRTDELPRLSVIVPCRNEERFIAQCLGSILRNNYPMDRLEILVVDGMSTDATWSIVGKYARQYAFVKRLRNGKRITPTGLNLGIESAAGEIICRVDAHARIAPDYLRRCVERLRNGDTDNVGGAMRTLPSHSSLTPRSIALCMSHKFGAGNSVFRTGSEKATYTDTVFGGCYRKETFARIGVFNERLPRSQDIEFNQRLRKSGGKILYDPAIQCDYFASPDLRSFLKHNFRDGVWSVLPFAFSRIMPVRWRHLVPLVFVATVVALAVLGCWFSPYWLLFILEMAIYFAVSVAFSIQVSWRQRNASFLFTMPLVFGARHFAYGLGSVCGAIQLLGNCSLFRALFRLVGFRRSEAAPTV
ncbi:MAG: glycosyltransferase family 2 protein [Candidatus Acidiferrales bacterium]